MKHTLTSLFLLLIVFSCGKKDSPQKVDLTKAEVQQDFLKGYKLMAVVLNSKAVKDNV